MKTCAAVILSWIFAVCSSCSDDLTVSSSSTCEEGQPATLYLTVRPTDMTVLTRGAGDDDYVSDLYLAIYDSDGTRIWSHYFDDLATDPSVDLTQGNIGLSLDVESTVDARILAVANINDVDRDLVTGYFDNAYFDTQSRLLKQAVVNLNDPTDVNVYTNTFLMSGWYAPSLDELGDINSIPSVTIRPGYNKLEGAVYLQRLMSYNKFSIQAADHITLKLNTWQVCNIPPSCYLFETGANANSYASSFQDSKKTHAFTAEGQAETFEFYQLENLHTGLAYEPLADGDFLGIKEDEDPQVMYDCREREYKDASGGNTGAYKSLAKTSQWNTDPLDDSNNNASFVVVNADISYYILDTADNRAHPELAQPVAYDSSLALIHRTANVNYTIHLGYCEDKDAHGQATLATARDFNCRRNSQYYYNVKINGVDNVVLEAKQIREEQPGAEGTVYDAYADEVYLDSHYSEFNIRLTDAERAALTYHVISPYDGAVHRYLRDKAGDYDPDWESDELFTWIKFAPTTEEGILASYNGGQDLWSIENLCDPTAYPGQSEWYTVFVDEYVYHFDDASDGTETSWAKYVNQDDRKVEFIDNQTVSSDGANTFSFCKYVFAQKSIQTYYKDLEEDVTALGVEHADETYCLNMDWDTRQPTTRNTTNYNYKNGRYNLWNYLSLAAITQWDQVIQETVPCHVDADRNTEAKVKTSHDAADYPIYQPYDKGVSRLSKSGGGYPSPGDARFFYANSLCMSRNRDLNGNGLIDADEVRWYLPTSHQYIQIAIGQDELPDPLLRFGDHDPSEFGNNSDDDRMGTYYYHHVTSDYQYFWAEQSVTVGNGPLNMNLTQCYTAKCVRTLGANPASTDDILDVASDPISKTYTHDATARTITLDKYTDVSLRGYSAGALVPHGLAAVAGRPYKKFKYAQAVCKNISGDYVTVNASGNISYVGGETSKADRTVAWTQSLFRNDICHYYSEESDRSDLGTWRVPNLKELSFLYLENLLSGQGYLLSSTHDHFYYDALKTHTVVQNLYLGYNDYSSNRVLARNIIDGSPVRVRCVKDVK